MDWNKTGEKSLPIIHMQSVIKKFKNLLNFRTSPWKEYKGFWKCLVTHRSSHGDWKLACIFSGRQILADYRWNMMTSSNGNVFRVTGPLCGEFTGPHEFPTQRPVTRTFDVFFDLRLNKRLSKQPWGWWFETPSWSLWRHRNETSMKHVRFLANFVRTLSLHVLLHATGRSANRKYEKS